MELTQEHRQTLKSLESHSGWKILLALAEERLDLCRNKLENDDKVNLREVQEYMKGVKFVLTRVGEANAK